MKPSKWLPGLLMPILFLIFILLLQLLPGFLIQMARAQSAPNTGQSLAVGQPVPDVHLKDLINYSAPTARLSDFRGKLLILDFWATWCGTCKAAMPKLDAIQREFEGQVQVLLVNSRSNKDTEDKVKAYFERWRHPDGGRYALPSVVNDTILGKLFPHRLIPHVVWIGPDGTLLATTGTDQVTPENVRKMLARERPVLPQKKDIDVTRPLFTMEELPAGNMLRYSILLKGKVSGLPSGSRIRQQGDTVNGAALTNTPLLTIYRLVQRALYPELGTKGLRVEVRDSAALYPDRSSLPDTDWKAQHLYSYDLVVPPHQADSLFYYMLSDLNNFSSYYAALEQRRMDCLVLVRKGKALPASQGGTPANQLFREKQPFLRNMPLSALVSRLNNHSGITLQVVDGTGYSGPVDIELPEGIGDLLSLRRDLQRQGLDLRQARRKVPVFVIREKPGVPPQAKR